jgi:hypothetical protein
MRVGNSTPMVDFVVLRSYDRAVTSEPADVDGDMRAGIDAAERYGTFAHNVVSAQFDAIRALPPPLPSPIPLVSPGSLWSGVGERVREVASQSAVVDAALATGVVDSARAFGVPVPPDVAARAAGGGTATDSAI